MGLNPHANGGLLRREIRLPDFHTYAVTVTSPGAPQAEATRIVGVFLRDVMKLNATNRNFSSYWSRRNIIQPPGRCLLRPLTASGWSALSPYDVHLSRDGRVMEVSSEHLCEGWLEG